MNTCRIIRLVENVGIEPLFLFPKQECKTITLRSPFGGWVIYPLTSHSSFAAPCKRILCLVSPSRQVLPPDIMYCTIASSPCQYLFKIFLKYFFAHNLSENVSRFEEQILPIKLYQIQHIVANCNQNLNKLFRFSSFLHAFGKFCSLFGCQIALDRRLRWLEPRCWTMHHQPIFVFVDNLDLIRPLIGELHHTRNPFAIRAIPRQCWFAFDKFNASFLHDFSPFISQAAQYKPLPFLRQDSLPLDG